MKRFQEDVNPTLSRRSMLSLPVRLAATGALSGVASSILGANEQVQIAIMGIGRRGPVLIDEFARQPNCRIAAVCDVDRTALDRATAQVEKLQGRRPKAYQDVRQLLADKDIDAIAIVAPNHWHALTTIWACQAGKDVYVEKPACFNIWEGPRMLEAMRKYGRIVQVGSQSRSIGHKIRAIQLLREGVIGKIYLARGLCFKPRNSIGHTPDIAVPEGIDWDLFRGPAPMRPFSMNRFQYNWHWFWDTGNGDIGNQGVHELDIARWGLNRGAWPKEIRATGGKCVYQDDQETPNTLLATFDYGDCQLVFEVRGLPTNPEENILIGDLFYGSEGYMAVDVNGFRVYHGDDRKKIMDEPFQEKKAWDTGPHLASFLKAVKSRNSNDLTAPLSEGILSANLCHLANISYRTGRTLKVDTRTGALGDPEAEALLRREYRAPYVVPERV
jgi:predicted dehydrogenase